MMNYRIESLLNQVGGYGTKALLHPEDIQKFAELIMIECAYACSSDRCGRTMSAEDLIKEHFEL